jgi:HlyD family secretion protein
VDFSNHFSGINAAMNITKRTIIIFLIALLVIFAGIVLVLFMGRDRVGPGMVRPETATAIKEKTIQAEIKQITDWYEAVGTVRPRTETRIEAQVSAQVVDVMVRAGDLVEKDQVLVALDNRQMDTRLSQARQALNTAISFKEQTRQSVNAAEAAFKEAEADHKRIKNYFESQASTKQELEKAESRYLQAGAGLKRAMEAMEAATAGIRQAEEMVREAEIFLGYTRVKAPDKGKVLERLIEPGDMAIPGKPLILIRTSGVLQLESFVREGLIGNVEPGAGLSAVIKTLDRTVKARVEEIIPYADPKTRTFLVKAILPEMEGLYPGMYGKLLIPFKTTEAVLIPPGAIRRIGQLEMVRVKKGDIWEKRYIKTGKIHEGLVEVLSGLSGNEILMVGEPANDGK